MTNTCIVFPTLPELSLPAWSCQKLGAISVLWASWDSLVPSAEVLQADSRQSLNLLCFILRHLWGWALQAVPDAESWLTLLLSDNGLPDIGDVINKRTPPLEITDRRNGHAGFVYLSCFFQTSVLGSLGRPSSKQSLGDFIWGATWKAMSLSEGHITQLWWLRVSTSTWHSYQRTTKLRLHCVLWKNKTHIKPTQDGGLCEMLPAWAHGTPHLIDW